MFRSAQLSAGILSLLFASTALAHVDVAGPGIAGSNQIVKFSIGHGCEGADTIGLELRIPSEITSLRVVEAPFGALTVARTSSTAPITAITWSKPDAEM